MQVAGCGWAGGEGNGLIGAEPGRDLDLGRRVALVELVVQIKPQGTDLNALDKMDIQAMGLRTVGSEG